MYYQNYEDYMRSVLGYPIENQNTHDTYNYSDMMYGTSQMPTMSNRYSSEIMELYPEIYRILNPMICKICEANTKPITRELIEKMTDEIYLNLEEQPLNDTVVNVRVNTPTVSEKQEKVNRVSSSPRPSSKTKSEENRTDNKEKIENREDRQQRRPNNTLRDLIRILILNQLLGGNFPNRPPRSPRPPVRPPMGPPPFPRNDMMYESYLKY